MASVLKPQWSLRVPDAARTAAFLDAQRAALPAFSYPEVGASRHNAERPHGYNLDHNRVRIGEGTADFAAACELFEKAFYTACGCRSELIFQLVEFVEEICGDVARHDSLRSSDKLRSDPTQQHQH